MRDAVDAIPPIDWRKELDNVVAFPERAAVGASHGPAEIAGTEPRGRRR